MGTIKNKYDFMILFDVKNGNPNGDPDNDGRPRINPETSMGLVSDVCLKRKIRDYVNDFMTDKEGFHIYVQSETTLNSNDKMAYSAFGIDDVAKTRKDDPDISLKIRDFMCQNFFDIRTFGAVMTTFVTDKLNCGQVKGPVQIGFAESVDPIMPMDVTITRKAITKDSDADKKNNEMGGKTIVPYALYVAHGHISCNLAKKTGFSENDLGLLWNAILHMFDNDSSASRAEMSMRKLIIFKHDSEWGNSPAYRLFESVNIKKKDEVNVPSCFGDYKLSIGEMPDGVTCKVME